MDVRAGRVVFVCRAGCTQDQIIEGLRSRGLWRSSSGPARDLAQRPWESPLTQARRELLLEARRQPWARLGVAWLYSLGDWIRSRRKAVDDLRRLAGYCLMHDACEACWTILARAARLEILLLCVEAELEDLLAEGGRW